MSIYEIHLKEISPISITKRVFGILYKTEIFIPSWTMWNAFVKLYALYNKSSGMVEYETAKKELKKIRLTNFYIFDKGKIINSFKDFDERKYISSDLKVAIDPLTNTSLEGAIYEREYLIAKEFVGWVKCEDENLKNFFSTAIKNKIIFIGADKNIGFGRVKIATVIDDRNDFIRIENNFVDKLENAEYASDKKTYLLPPEVKDKDKDKDKVIKNKNYFPLVLRMWDEEKGSGMKIEKIY